MSQRDSQRSRVYAAEYTIRDSTVRAIATRRVPTFGRPSESIDDIRAYVVDLMSRPAVVKEFGRRPQPAVEVGSPQQRRGLYYTMGQRIALPNDHFGSSVTTIVHELAHHLTYMKYGGRVGHGWQFAHTLLVLYGAAFGAKARKALAASFKANRVRHRPKRTMTPEQRARAAAILAEARAKKKRMDEEREAERLRYIGNPQSVPVAQTPPT